MFVIISRLWRKYIIKKRSTSGFISDCAVLTPSDSETQVVPYDETLLERCRLLWQDAKWQELFELDGTALQHHPDRSKMALFVASAYQQMGNHASARSFARQAQDWGCNKRFMSQLLIAGVHNTLGRASAVASLPDRSVAHFRLAISASGIPAADVNLLGQARAELESSRMGLHKRDGSCNHKLRDDPPRQQGAEISFSTSEIPTARHANGMFSNSETGKESGHSTHPQQTQNGKKFSSDAEIDDLIQDITPFFFGRQITYVDVGAYLGEIFLKILDSKNIKIREAHSIEPNPTSYATLIRNVSRASLSSLHTYNFGISSQLGERRFSAARSMTKIIDSPLLGTHVGNTFSATCHPLDTLSESFTDRRIDILKVDVEGKELDVLMSATSLLQDQRIDFIYLEVGLNKEGTQQTYFADLDRLLQQYGYRVFKIYEQKNEWPLDSPFLRRCNFAYMSTRFAGANPFNATKEIYRLKQELAQAR